MAITIHATGSGTATPIVATEAIATEHYQLVKLIDGTAAGTGRIGGDATNGLDVDVTRITGNVATTNAIVDGWDNAASDGASISGDVAHDAADAGEPVKIGLRAIAHGANPTAVAAADRTNWYANVHGIPFMIGGHMNCKSATYITTAAQTDDNVLAAIAAGTLYGITRITITLDEATTVGVGVRLGFGTTVVPALGASGADAVDDILVYHPGLIPGGGITIGDGSGLLGVGGDGAELRITNEVPTSGTLAVTVTYFTISV